MVSTVNLALTAWVVCGINEFRHMHAYVQSENIVSFRTTIELLKHSYRNYI